MSEDIEGNFSVVCEEKVGCVFNVKSGESYPHKLGQAVEIIELTVL